MLPSKTLNGQFPLPTCTERLHFYIDTDVRPLKPTKLASAGDDAATKTTAHP